MDASPLITVLGFVFLGAGAVFLPCGIYVQRRVSSAERNCCQPLTAKVVDRVERVTGRVDRQDTTAWFPVVEYEWNGRAYRVEAGMGMWKRHCPQTGDMLEIMVNPCNPGQVYIPQARGQNLMWMTICGAIMLPAGILMVIPFFMDALS